MPRIYETLEKLKFPQKATRNVKLLYAENYRTVYSSYSPQKIGQLIKLRYINSEV